MSRQHAGKLSRLILPLLLTVAVVILGGLSILRKVESFQSLGFTAKTGLGVWVVEGEPEAPTGLRAGDQISLVGGAPLGTPAAVRERLIATPEVELGLLRGEELITVTYHRPGLDIDWPYLVQIVLGLAYLLIGLFTLVRSQRRPGLLFFLWCVVSAAAYLLTKPRFFDAIGKTIFLADGWALALLAPLTLHLFLAFPTLLGVGGKARRFLPFLYLPAALLVAVQVDQGLFAGRLFSGPPSARLVLLQGRLETYHLAVFVLASLLVLAYRLSGKLEADQRRQLRWIAFGVAGGYLPYILLNVVPTALSLPRFELLELASVVPLALLPLAFGYAILRYKLWDLDIIVRDTIAYSLTLLIGVLGFALINLGLRRGMPQDLATARHLLSFIAGLSIAGLLVPTRKAIASSLEHWQHRGHYEQRRSLLSFADQLLHERRLDPLCSSLLDRLEESLQFGELNLYLSQGEAQVAVRPRAELPARLAFDALGDEFWDREVEAVPSAELSTGEPSPVQRLFMAGYRYAFPMSVRGHRVGTLLVGYKQDMMPLSSEDVDLVRQVANQAALALENAQLLEELHLRLDEVVRLEKYSQGIIESTPAGIAVLGSGDRVTSCNLAFAALLNMERSEVRGAVIDDLLPATLPRPGSGLVETKITFAEGRERSFQLSVAELGAVDGDRQRILVVHDVSERVELENQLKEKDRLASLGMLAAGVAHEVNTPITGISSYAQMLLEETPVDDPRHSLLLKVERQTFRASRIVNSLLEFSRDRRETVRSLDLRVLLRETFDLLSDRIEDSAVTLDLTLPESAVLVEGSGTELQQVFTNLAVNALDAMDPLESGAGRLAVSVESEGEQARVVVRDNGEGMSREQMEKIFQPFFSTKLASGGTGLGLSISYEIVRRHDGELKVSSVEDEGSRFVVELPVCLPVETQLAEPTHSDLGAEGSVVG